MTAAPLLAALDLSRPFTRADAVAAGLDPRMLRGSRFRRIFRGVYVLSSTPDDVVVRARAALAIHPPDAFASHVTAARLYGLPVPPGPDEHVSVRRQQDRRRRPGLHAHVAPPLAATRTRHGVRVSSPVQMFVELASVLSLVDLVVVGDALVKVFGLTARELRAGCAASRAPNAVAARRAARYVRDEVDSPMETRLRMLVVLAGLPEPQVNHVVHDARGRVVVRLDLAYPDLKLAVEYDGRQHAEDSVQWRRDIARREYLDESGWRLVVVTSAGVYREPERTLARIRDAIVGRGGPVPRRFRDEWRPHFRGR